MRRKDFEQILKLMEGEKRTQKPQMIVGAGFIQTLFDTGGRESLIDFFNTYDVTTCADGAKLADKLCAT